MSNSKKLFLTCASGQLGGTEIRMLDESLALNSMGYQAEVGVFPFPRQAAYEKLLSEAGVQHSVFNPPAVLTQWNRRHLAWLQAQCMAKSHYKHFDLAHVFFPWSNQGLDQLWFLSQCGVPSIISVHNTFPPAEFTPWHQRHFKTAFSQLRAVYGVSQQALDHFLDLFADFIPSDCLSQVIYNFVDINRFQPSTEHRQAVRESLGIADKTPLVGSIGRLHDQKRPLYLVEVFAAIKAACPDTQFLLIGEGSLEGEVRQAVEAKGLVESLTILPFQKDIERYFPALDVHLLMSRNEGFGIVTAEALACGVPCVATEVPGTTEVVAGCEAGQLVPLEGISETVDATKAFLNNEPVKRDFLAQKARQHVLDNFSKDSWFNQIEQLYRKVLEG